ncbi:hypothetical protein [Psychrobacillus sp. BM2]|uniref:hypothetical protein n=1 Tax=Psychrobacillus sp. BM2 TaxID=3400421 RepID=UPI003B0260C7
MNENLLTKLKLLSNATARKVLTVNEITTSTSPIRRTRGQRNRNESSKKQSIKNQLKEL